MKNRPVPPSAIVVGLVRSGSRAALGWAVDEALATSRPLHVMHVLDGGDHTPVDLEGHVDVVTEAAVTGILEAHPSVRVSAHTDTGSAAAALVTASRSARTLVVGAATHGLLEAALLGSVALQVAAHSFCPVVVLHDRESDGETSEGGSAPTAREPGRVVVGLDASERSERALAFGFEQASRREVGLTAVACWTWEDSVGEVPGPLALGAWEDGRQHERRLVAELLAGWRGKYPDVDVRTHLVHARVVSTLLDVATDASLLVVGTRGRGGFDGLLLGSVSQRVLERASCPVAVVPAPDLDLGRAPR